LFALAREWGISLFFVKFSSWQWLDPATELKFIFFLFLLANCTAARLIVFSGGQQAAKGNNQRQAATESK